MADMHENITTLADHKAIAESILLVSPITATISAQLLMTAIWPLLKRYSNN